MMTHTKSQTLWRAASLSFALTGILPLLTFAYTLIRLNGLWELQDQLTLGFALMTALTGFRVLRVMVTRMSNLIQFAGRITEQSEVRVPGIGRL